MLNATPKNVAELVAKASAGADATKVANEIASLRNGYDQLEKLAAAIEVVRAELAEREKQMQFMLMMQDDLAG